MHSILTRLRFQIGSGLNESGSETLPKYTVHTRAIRIKTNKITTCARFRTCKWKIQWCGFAQIQNFWPDPDLSQRWEMSFYDIIYLYHKLFIIIYNYLSTEHYINAKVNYFSFLIKFWYQCFLEILPFSFTVKNMIQKRIRILNFLLKKPGPE
jgi:hypothetical protein